MKILYYDCFSGISGDMNLGALIDLGVQEEYLINELKKLKIDDEFQLIVKKHSQKGISGTKAHVILKHWHEEEHHKHSHKEGEHHHHRTFKHIRDMICSSELSEEVKNLSLKIFEQVAIAEAKVHNKPIDEVHFHEVGAVDSIVDIVGAAICIDYIKPDIIIGSSIEVGYGFLKCAHGTLPVPAPATAEILKGVPITSSKVPFEATTPTGAAIVKALCSDFTERKDFIIAAIGYGLGSKEGVEVPNVLRVFLGNTATNMDKEYVVECTIDDMIGEDYELLMERLFENGAMDVYYSPVFMKKQRPGINISVLCNEKNLGRIKHIIFYNSTTLGVRYYEIQREKLKREFVKVNSKFGEITMKVSYYKDKELRVKPEYEDCKKLAKKFDVSVNEVYLDAIKSYKS